jgi:hypothetical protein
MNEEKTEGRMQWVVMWDASTPKGIATDKESAQAFGDVMLRRDGRSVQRKWVEHASHVRRLMDYNPMSGRWVWSLVSIHEVPVVTPQQTRTGALHG